VLLDKGEISQFNVQREISQFNVQREISQYKVQCHFGKDAFESSFDLL
jgi:hypothetical protein